MLSTTAQVYLTLVLALAVIAIAPTALGWRASTVESGSMEPVISAGDVVLSTSLPEGSPAPVGRVVEFERRSSDGRVTTILHRIVADNHDGTYVTAGDANSDPDSQHITRADITAQGRVLVPFVGLPSLWLRTGQYPPLALWATLSALAVALLAHGLTPTRSPPRGGAGPRRGQDHAAGGSASPGGGSVPAHTGALHRRAVLLLALGSVVAGVVTLPGKRADAAFTARTETTKNSWSVKTLPALSHGRATPYALFAASGVHDTGVFGTFIDGSVGTSRGVLISGFPSGSISGGRDADNQVARNAKTDLQALYAVIAARRTTDSLPSRPRGTIRAGVHGVTTGSLVLEGTVTLDAEGDGSALFIIQARTIATARDARLRLINGAVPANVYWRATETITMSRDSVVSGSFLATGNAAMERDCDLTGRLVSLNGTITINRSTVRIPR